MFSVCGFCQRPCRVYMPTRPNLSLAKRKYLDHTQPRLSSWVVSTDARIRASFSAVGRRSWKLRLYHREVFCCWRDWHCPKTLCWFRSSTRVVYTWSRPSHFSGNWDARRFGQRPSRRTQSLHAHITVNCARQWCSRVFQSESTDLHWAQESEFSPTIT